MNTNIIVVQVLITATIGILGRCKMTDKIKRGLYDCG